MSTIVPSKLAPTIICDDQTPDFPPVDSLAAHHGVVSIVAPAGYGKTTLAARIRHRRTAAATAWVSVDLVDREAHAFWCHVLAALAGCGADTNKAQQVLDERGATGSSFAGALATLILEAPQRLTLVLDDADRIEDSDVLETIAFLVERAGERLDLVVTGRIDPRLPLGRWRATDRLVETRRGQLQLTDLAARRVVEQQMPGVLQPESVAALNERLDGWPIGWQIVLMAVRMSDDPEAEVRQIVDARRPIADYLTDEVLSSFSDDERATALGLAVFSWFDTDLVHEVLGPDILPSVRTLLDRQLVQVVPGTDRSRLHRLVRELLDEHLRWHDPARREALHRRAAAALIARGDRFAAAEHLLAVGDVSAASEVVAQPAMRLVDNGLLSSLQTVMADFPPGLVIHDPERTIDVALAHFLTGRFRDARRWIAQASAVTPRDGGRLATRVTALQVVDKMVHGASNGVREQLAEIDRRWEVEPDDWEFANRYPTLAARCSVLLDLPEADDRIEAIRVAPIPAEVVAVVVPALQAIRAFDSGDLRRASSLAHRALAGAERSSLDDHPSTMEALLAAGWCAWGRGEVDLAVELAARAETHPLHGSTLFRVRAGVLAVSAGIRLDRPAAASRLAELEDAVFPLPDDYLLAPMRWVRGHLANHLGDHEAALAAVESDVRPSSQIEAAWALRQLGRPGDALDRLASSDMWSLHHSAAAAAITASITGVALAGVALVEAARVEGWSIPVIDWVSSPSGGSPAERQFAGLTARELSLLELLPTHLSYRQIGERLHLSVNTVKSNLQSVYRKLGVATRHDAVSVAEASGLLSERRSG